MRAELVLIEIGTAEIDRLDVELDFEELDSDIRLRLNRLVREYESERAERQRRELAAERLEFPFHQPRPGQQEIIDRSGLAVEQREHLLGPGADRPGQDRRRPLPRAP